MERKASFIAAIGMLIFCSFIGISRANATSQTFYFDTTNFDNTNLLEKLTTPPGYGNVTVTEISGGLHFVVSANTDYFKGSKLKWDNFLFNIKGDITIGINNISIEGKKDWGIDYNQTRAGFGTFEFLLKGTANSPSMSNPLTFDLLNPSGVILTIDDIDIANSNGYTFNAHLRNFTSINGQTSTWLGVDPPPPTTVPEPATMLLFGTGTAGLATLIRRRNRI